jgi:hypothetical protein
MQKENEEKLYPRKKLFKEIVGIKKHIQQNVMQTQLALN